MNEYDELLAENAALRETLGKTLDALEAQMVRQSGLDYVPGPPGSIIGDARRRLGRVK